MLTYKVKLSKAARTELDRVISYVEDNYGWYSAGIVMRRIKRAMSSLTLFPERKPIGRLRRPLWMIHTGKYNMMYYIDKEERTVEIVHILNAKQDYTRFLK